MIYTKTIRDTFIFNTMNENSFIDNKVKTFMDPNKSIFCTSEMLQEPLMQIDRNFKYANKLAVLEAFKNGILVPVITQNSVKETMPIGIPFIINKDRSRAIVFISNYSRFDGKYISIDYKKFYCLMESAYTALHGINVNNSDVINKGSYIWANIFTKVLNKKFALNTDKNALNKVIFLASKYYLINILGMKDNSTAFNYALKNCKNVTEIFIKEIDSEFEPEDYSSIATFLTKFSKASYKFVHGFEKITVRDYIASYCEMYGNAMLFSLELIDYFMFNISSIIIGAYLNNQTILEDLVDTDGGKLYFAVNGE